LRFDSTLFPLFGLEVWTMELGMRLRALWLIGATFMFGLAVAFALLYTAHTLGIDVPTPLSFVIDGGANG